MSDPKKPGIRTSEFWLSVAAVIAAHVAGLSLGGETGTIVSAVCTGVVVIAYTLVRGKIKWDRTIADLAKELEEGIADDEEAEGDNDDESPKETKED
jgi:hypothetical protein